MKLSDGDSTHFSIISNSFLVAGSGLFFTLKNELSPPFVFLIHAKKNPSPFTLSGQKRYPVKPEDEVDSTIPHLSSIESFMLPVDSWPVIQSSISSSSSLE